jgi:hypothetical protein
MARTAKTTKTRQRASLSPSVHQPTSPTGKKTPASKRVSKKKLPTPVESASSSSEDESETLSSPSPSPPRIKSKTPKKAARKSLPTILDPNDFSPRALKKIVAAFIKERGGLKGMGLEEGEAEVLEDDEDERAFQLSDVDEDDEAEKDQKAYVVVYSCNSDLIDVSHCRKELANRWRGEG